MTYSSYDLFCAVMDTAIICFVVGLVLGWMI